jgi:hypothetical protein
MGHFARLFEARLAARRLKRNSYGSLSESIGGPAMPPPIIVDPKHCRERTARMQVLAFEMAGSLAAILMNDLAIHYEKLADQAALKGNSPLNGKPRLAVSRPKARA